MQSLLVLICCLAPSLAFQWEFVVEGNKKACFEDYLTNETTIIYGFTPFQVSSAEDLIMAMTPLANISLQAFNDISTETGKAPQAEPEAAGGALRRRLQEAGLTETGLDLDRKFRHGAASQGPAVEHGPGDAEVDDEGRPSLRRLLADNGDSSEQNVVPLEESERKVYKGKKNEKENDGKVKTATEPIDLKTDKETYKRKGAMKPDKEAKGLGSLEILNSSGMKLSPAKVTPYSLYKLSIKKPFEIITVCYESFIEDDTLIRLTYKSHHKSFEEIPSKEDSDLVMQSLTKVENTFEEFLKNYEELQRFEERFVSTSNDTLSSFMTFGQILLLAYLVVVWILKLLIEKTFRYKKII